MSNETVQTVGPSQAQLKKKANAARWAKISGGVFAAVMIVRGAMIFLPKDLPHCDDSTVQSTAEDVMNGVLAKQPGRLKVKSITAIKDGERADKLAKCTGVVTISDNSKGALTYQIERGKGGDQVRILNVQPL